MYSECLNKNDCNLIRIVEDVLENLCEDTKEELKKIYGENSDYLNSAFEDVKDTDIFVIRLKSNHEPAGIYGLIQLEDYMAGIYLLTTDNFHKGNIITFLKGARKQVNQWCSDYKLIMDNCDKQNKTIQKWLRLLGFKPSEYQNDNFQIYYKGDINLYEP